MTGKSDIKLACTAVLTAKTLDINYTIFNRSPAAIFVMDILPVDGLNASGLEQNPALQTIMAGDDHVTIVRGMPPMPRFTVTVKIIPLGTELAANAQIERRIKMRLPLAERSPYFGELPLRQYEHAMANAMTLVVSFMRKSAKGFAAEPTPGADGPLMRVSSLYTVGDIETLSCSVPVRGLSILKRNDGFPRNL